MALDGFLLPIGGHKGVRVWLSYVSGPVGWPVVGWFLPDPCEVLGGCAGRTAEPWPFFIVIATKVLVSTQWLASRMSDFAAILHGGPAADANKPVLVPGEIELGHMARQRQHGIRIEAELLALLRQHAANCPG